MSRRDLDWGDVLDDAARMEADYWHELWIETDREDLTELQRRRYYLGITNRTEPDGWSLRMARLIDDLILNRINTTLCEGCLDRYGCDMCNPYDPTWEYEAYNRDLEEQSLGRPLFPNEY